MFLIRYMISKYFLPFSGLSIHSLDGIVHSTKIFNFDGIQLIFFLFLVLFKLYMKLLPNPRS